MFRRYVCNAACRDIQPVTKINMNEFSETLIDSQTDKDIERSRELVLSGRKLEREDIVKALQDEVWADHALTFSFLKHHNLEPASELGNAINELCMKSHNDVLKLLIKKYS